MNITSPSSFDRVFKETVVSPLSISTARKFTDLPFVDAGRLYRAAWQGHTPASGTGDAPISLLGRVKMLAAALFLSVPLLNIVTDFVLRYFFPPINPLENSDSTNADSGSRPLIHNLFIASPEETKRPPPVKVNLSDAEIGQWENGFKNQVEEDVLFTSVPNSVSSLVQIIMKKVPNPEERRQIIERIGQDMKMGQGAFADVNWSGNKRMLLFYHMLNDLSLTQATEKFKNLRLKNQVDVTKINVPGDGNCFLWSVLTLFEAQKNNVVNVASADYSRGGYLDQQMTELRKKMKELFLQKIQDPKETAFKSQMLTYITFNDAFKNLVEKSKGDEKTLIDGFAELLNSRGQWNGEVEGQLVAEILDRPIIIFQRQPDNSFVYRSIAGVHLWSQNENKPPIVVLHQGIHYDALA